MTNAERVRRLSWELAIVLALPPGHAARWRWVPQLAQALADCGPGSPRHVTKLDSIVVPVPAN